MPASQLVLCYVVLCCVVLCVLCRCLVNIDSHINLSCSWVVVLRLTPASLGMTSKRLWAMSTPAKRRGLSEQHLLLLS